MSRRLSVALLATAALAACAGRNPQPVALSQPGDIVASCEQLRAEMAQNDQKIADLGSEQGQKVAQNIAAGVAGIIIWPAWFLMDFKGAATADKASYEQRQAQVATLATQRCSQPPQPVPAVASSSSPATLPPGALR